MSEISELLKKDKDTKPKEFDEEVSTLVAYYDDVSRGLTFDRLMEMGLGIKDNRNPLEVSLLRRIIDRISVVYKNPPTRWLRMGEQRLLESDPQHVLMQELLDKSQYDLAWRRVDRIRSLVRQCVIRFYPSDTEQSVVARVFTPNHVFREPDPVAADFLEEDRQFALALGGGIYEHFQRLSDGKWKVTWVDEEGTLTASQPSLDGMLPYGELPAMMVYDDWSGGRAWLPPRCSRRSWVEAINLIANDLWSLIVNQAHDKAIFKTDDPSRQFPSQHGHSTVATIHAEEDLEVLQSNPKIKECMDVLETLTRLWMISEDLPANELDKSKQVVTGATLKVQERPLISRMEAQAPLASRDEARSWAKFREVHNRFADMWGVESLDPDTVMEVEVADMLIPMDAREQQEVAARDMALGAASTIDHIQARFGVPRHKAIDIWHRVQDDMDDFPIPGIEIEDEEPQEEPFQESQEESVDAPEENMVENDSQ